MHHQDGDHWPWAMPLQGACSIGMRMRTVCSLGASGPQAVHADTVSRDRAACGILAYRPGKRANGRAPPTARTDTKNCDGKAHDAASDLSELQLPVQMEAQSQACRHEHDPGWPNPDRALHSVDQLRQQQHHRQLVEPIRGVDAVVVEKRRQKESGEARVVPSNTDRYTDRQAQCRDVTEHLNHAMIHPFRRRVAGRGFGAGWLA